MKRLLSLSLKSGFKRRALLSFLIILAALFTYIAAVGSGMDFDAPPGEAGDDAVIDIIVSGEGLIKTNLAVPSFVAGPGVKDGGNLGYEGAQIIAHDLQFSSFYNIVSAPKLPPAPQGGYDEKNLNLDNYQSARAELLVAGTYSLDADGNYTFDFRLFDITQKILLTSAVYKGKKEMFRRLMHRFADEVLRIETGTAGPFESRIAFVAESAGKKEIFICDTDGQNLIKLTNNGATNLSPTWSPDASQIAYTSYILNNPDIFILPITGGRPRMLFGGRGLNYGSDWSPANNRITFASSNNQNGDQEIYSIRPDGKDLVQVTHDPWSIDVSPTWSPDGKYIAFVSSRYGDKPQVLAAPASGGTALRISRTGGYNTDPSWGKSPTGEYIAYCGRAGGGLDILAVSMGKNLQVLETLAIITTPGADETPSFSPDGRFIAYSHGFSNEYDIYMTSVREQKPRCIIKLSGKEMAPVWSSRLYKR